MGKNNRGGVSLSKKLFCITLVLTMVTLLFSIPSVAQATGDLTVTIFHTNDIHGRFEEDAFAGNIGLAKIATILKSVENGILLDAGDVIHGQVIVTLDQGESAIRMMNAVGYTAMVPGNHDFNYGYERLLALADLAEFDILCANISKDGVPIFQPYKIIEVKGKKLGVFGLTTPETKYKSHPDNTAGLLFHDSVALAKAMVAELAPQVDVVIALTHLGQDIASEETSLMVAREVDGIDLIIDGHSHHSWTDVKSVGDTVIVMAGEYSKELGRVDLIFRDDGFSIATSVITAAAAEDIVPDPGVLALIADIRGEQDIVLSQVIGSSKVDLQGDRGFVRVGETNLGNLITDAMVWATKADIAITNGGGIRASIPAGKITVGNVISVLPFGNYVVVKRMRGKDIITALEHGLSMWPESNGAFPQVAGLEYTVCAGKVFNVKVAGKPLLPSKHYTVATNDFLAAGGDGYTIFAGQEHVGEYAGLDEILMEYIYAHGDVCPEVEGRMNTLKASYIVKKGDVLWRIAKAHGLPWREVAAFNELRNPHLIFPGQLIRIPGQSQ